MNRLLTNMEPRTIALLMVSTAILVAAALGRYVIWPEVQSYNKSRIELASLVSVASQQTSLSMQIEILESKLSTLKNKLQGGMVDLPDNQMESFVIGQLQGISWRNKIELMGVRPGKGSIIQALERGGFTGTIHTVCQRRYAGQRHGKWPRFKTSSCEPT